MKLKKKIMNFWQIEKLKEELANETISQRNLFFYYLLLGILISSLLIPNFNPYEDFQAVRLPWIEWKITSIVYLLGIYFSYKANKGNLGKNFIDRIVSLEIVLNIRYLIFLFLPLTIVWVIFFDGGIYSDSVQLFNSIVFDVVVTMRTIFCMKDVSNQI